MPRKSTCEVITETLVRYLAIFSIFTDPNRTLVKAKVAPLNNLNSMECQQTLIDSVDDFPTVITGATNCPDYQKLLPVFSQACDELPNRNCYSFNYTADTALNDKAAMDCLGHRPVISPLASQHYVARGNPQIGNMVLGPVNLGGGLNGNSTVNDVKDFINTVKPDTSLNINLPKIQRC